MFILFSAQLGGAELPEPDFAALVAGTPSGGILRLPPGSVFRVRTSVVITRSIAIDGKGDRLVAADGARIAGALIRSVGVSGVTISNLTVDANVEHNGADYGIWITGGDQHHVFRTTIKNTSQACLFLENASGAIEDNHLSNCGRDLTIEGGSAANNHGIMVAALTGKISQVNVSRNNVYGTSRKCITTYARATGEIADAVIADNVVSGCGLGGIYVANAPGARPQTHLLVSGNTARESYVGFEMADIVGLTMTGNRAEASRGGQGDHGGQGLVIDRVENAEIRNMRVDESGGGGILVRGSSNIRLVAPVVTDANAGRYAFAAGIQFVGTRNSRAERITVVDRASGHPATHGFVESDGSRENVVTVDAIAGVGQSMYRTSSPR